MGKRHVGFNIWWPDRPVGSGRLRRSLTPHPGTLVLTLVLVLALFWAQSAGALPLPVQHSPSFISTGTIAYQGRLADASGNPLTAVVNMEFRLYDAPTGGAPLWEELWTGPSAVQVSDGLFNVMLGSLAPIQQSIVSSSASLYLGITAGTDDEMAPRVQLGSVPFAVQALTVPDGSIATAKIADGAVTGAKVADKSITTSKLASGTVVNRYYVEWFSSETPCSTNSTSYVDCGNTLGGGFVRSFPAPAPETVRQYRLMVASANNLGPEGSTSWLQVYQRDAGTTVHEFDLGRQHSWPDYQIWNYSSPIIFNENVHLEFRVKLSQPGYTLWVYRVWVMAEDVVP